MELESRFFSIAGKGQWLRGHGTGIMYHHKGIQIEPQMDYFLEATYTLQEEVVEPFKKVLFIWLDRYQRLRWIDDQGVCHRFDMESGHDYPICTFDYLKDSVMFLFAGWHDVFIAYDLDVKELLFFSLRSGELIRRITDLPFEMEEMHLEDEGIIKLRTNDGHYYRVDIPTGDTKEIDVSDYGAIQSDPLNLRDKGYQICEGKGTIVAYDPVNDLMKVWIQSPYYSGYGMLGDTESLYYSRCFDSHEEEKEWQRLMAEIEVPKGSQIEIKYCAFDEEPFMFKDEWVSLEQVLQNPSVTIQEKEILMEERWSDPIINVKDTLLTDAIGRYFVVRIRMIGTKEYSPFMKRLRLYYETIDYRKMLPEIYQGDHDSSGFLKRYLSIFETMLMGMEEEIDHMSRHFDRSFVKGDWLKWLASWLKLKFIENWPDEKIRKFLEWAPTYYRMRGTKQGIEELIEFCLEEKPIIIEYDQIKGSAIKPNSIMANVDQWSVLILLRHTSVLSDDELQQLKELIKDEVPAYLKIMIVPLNALVFLDQHTYLGINAKLSDHRRMELDGQQMMIQNTLKENSYYELQRQWIKSLIIGPRS